MRIIRHLGTLDLSFLYITENTMMALWWHATKEGIANVGSKSSRQKYFPTQELLGLPISSHGWRWNPLVWVSSHDHQIFFRRWPRNWHHSLWKSMNGLHRYVTNPQWNHSLGTTQNFPQLLPLSPTVPGTQCIFELKMWGTICNLYLSAGKRYRAHLMLVKSA